MMTDQVIAAIARRVAVAAAKRGYERTAETSKDFAAALTELCAAVKAEQAEGPPDAH